MAITMAITMVVAMTSAAAAMTVAMIIITGTSRPIGNLRYRWLQRSSAGGFGRLRVFAATRTQIQEPLAYRYGEVGRSRPAHAVASR